MDLRTERFDFYPLALNGLVGLRAGSATARRIFRRPQFFSRDIVGGSPIIDLYRGGGGLGRIRLETTAAIRST